MGIKINKRNKCRILYFIPLYIAEIINEIIRTKIAIDEREKINN